MASREGQGGGAIISPRISCNAGYEKAYIDLAFLLARHGRLLEAEKELEKVLIINAHNMQALTAQGMVLTRLDERDKAIADFRRVIELAPDSGDAHMNLGIALADQGELQGALSEFSEAVRMAPNDSAPHYNRGRVLFDLAGLMKRSRTGTAIARALELGMHTIPRND